MISSIIYLLLARAFSKSLSMVTQSYSYLEKKSVAFLKKSFKTPLYLIQKKTPLIRSTALDTLLRGTILRDTYLFNFSLYGKLIIPKLPIVKDKAEYPIKGFPSLRHSLSEKNSIKHTLQNVFYTHYDFKMAFIDRYYSDLEVFFDEHLRKKAVLSY